MTFSERTPWKALRKHRLPIRRQAPIGRYIADFAIHSAALVIEIDGAWHDEPENQLRDLRRDAWLKAHGYRVLRFRNQQVLEDLGGVVDMILASLPPRWGKGGVGGACTVASCKSLEAVQPLAPFPDRLARTPTQPSPIEGESYAGEGS